MSVMKALNNSGADRIISTVPEITYFEWKGIDIVHVDLDTLLVDNTTSPGDWINQARELGQIGNYWP